jgi:hypothetical protein
VQLRSRSRGPGGKLNWTLLTAILGAHHFVVLRDTTFRAPCLPIRSAKMTLTLIRHIMEPITHVSVQKMQAAPHRLRYVGRHRCGSTASASFDCLSDVWSKFHHNRLTMGPHCRRCRCCPDRPSLALRRLSCKTTVAVLSPQQGWTGVHRRVEPCSTLFLSPRLRETTRGPDRQ